MKRIAVLLLTILSFNLSAQTTRIARLKPTVERLTIHSYNISSVIDDREDTTKIGTMRAGLTNKKAFVNLPGGARAAISAFFEENIWQSPATDSIELHIQELTINEKASTFKERATLNTRYGFFRKGTKLIEYSGNAYVESGTDVSPFIGKLVSESLEKVLKEFDNWWPDNKHLFDDSKRNELKVQVKLQPTGSGPDEIVYSTSRPLTIDDFKGKPDDLSKALAATYSSFSLQYEMQGDHTGSTATVLIKPYFLRSKSWMKPNGKVPYVLRHEQVHFDIATLKACELVIELRSMNFKVSDFKDQVNALQQKYSSEMEKMQGDYDTETSHGIFKEKQNLWQARIQKELQQKLAEAAL